MYTLRRTELIPDRKAQYLQKCIQILKYHRKYVFICTYTWKRKGNVCELVLRILYIVGGGGHSYNDPHVGFRVLKRFPFGLRDVYNVYNAYVTPTLLYADTPYT